MDDNLLPNQEDDGMKIQPEHYAPCIPLLLVNGSTGIGTGWSCCWPRHDPVQLIDYLLGQTNTLKPAFKGYNGTVKYDENYNIVSTGKWSRRTKNRIIISELPIGVWTDDYKKYIEDLMDSLQRNAGSRECKALR